MATPLGAEFSCMCTCRGIVRRNSFWDYLVFGRIQNALGGRVRIVVTGSAPISAKVLTFLRCALGCHVSLDAPF